MKNSLMLAGILCYLCACETDIGHPPVDTAKYGQIAVTSADTSLHAAIFLDNVATGLVTPAILEKVPVGQHGIRLLLAGYRAHPEIIIIEVAANSQHDAAFELLSVETGVLTVTTDPPGATVFLDTLPVGRTPVSLQGVETGDHDLVLRKNGCDEYASIISIEGGEITTINRVLPILGKTPLVEHFSNSSCVPCVTADRILDTVLINFGTKRRTSIGYHVDWPSPDDPMYQLALADNNTRKAYYGISTVPFFAIDGQRIMSFGSATLDDSIRNRLYPQSQQSPAVLLDVWSLSNTDTLKGEIHFRALQSVSATLTVAVIEREVIYASPPGTNGQTRFTDVFRGYFGPSGQSVGLSAGDTLMVPYAIPKNAAWGQTDVVVFLQSGPEIIQSAWTVYP